MVLFDGSREFDNEDKEIIDLVDKSNKEKIVIINKIDLPLKLILEDENIIRLNAKEDINLLIGRVEELLNANTHSDDMTLVSKQQVNEVQNTLLHIKQASEPLKTGELEFFAHHINEALENISNITRPYEHTQMLDVMFGEFCLGK